jgi:hypothetical protein
MPNLIPLLLLIVHTCCYASGHHRGEEDIELSKPIMRFLAKVREDQSGEYDDYYPNDSTEEVKFMRKLSISVDTHLSEWKETKHNNTPIKNKSSKCTVDDKEKE